jgi:hypothetical protein
MYGMAYLTKTASWAIDRAYEQVPHDSSDIDTIYHFVIGRLCENSMYTSASDFNGDQGVQGSDGSLKWLEGSDLIGKDAKRAVMCVKTNAQRDSIFVWTKPGIALDLLEDLVEGGIVSVVVHGGDSER